MATLMEKDILIEGVSHVFNDIMFKSRGGELTDDQIALIELEEKLYSTDAEDIDFESVQEVYLNIGKRYENLPRVLLG